MSIATIITGGYGSFGSIGKVVTLGYTPGNVIGAATAVISELMHRAVMSEDVVSSEITETYVNGVLTNIE